MSKYHWKDVGVGVLCWHIHHEKLLEMSAKPLKTRADFIRMNKPGEQIALRLRLMRPVKNLNLLPKEVRKAVKLVEKALKAKNKTSELHLKNHFGEKTSAARDRAFDIYCQVGAALNSTLINHWNEIEELHRKECSPTCTWDGYKIC